MKPIEEVLLDYAKTMLKDLGKTDGRSYLLRCMPLWRETYGETVATKVGQGIRVMLKEAG